MINLEEIINNQFEKLDIPKMSITSETPMEKLGLDSLDIIDICMEVEKIAGKRVDAEVEELNDMKTVQDFKEIFRKQGFEIE